MLSAITVSLWHPQRCRIHRWFLLYRSDHLVSYFCNMNILCNFHNTWRFTVNILQLKLKDLLNNNKPTSPLVYSNSAPLQQLIWMLFCFFSTMKIRVDKEKKLCFFKVQTYLIIKRCFFMCHLCRSTLKDTLTLQMEPVLEWNIVWISHAADLLH